MVGVASSVAFLGALGLLGIAIVGRLAPELDRVERTAYGPPLGVTVGSLALLIVASLIGRLSVVLVAGLVVLAVPLALRLGRTTPRPRDESAEGSPIPRRRAARLVPWVILGLLCLRWMLFWSGAVTTEPDGLYVGSRYLYGDFAQHLGDVMSFAFGDNFPPQHPRFAGSPFAYHYLTSITSAALVVLGLGAGAALVIPGFLFSCTAALAVFAFARRATHDGTVAALAVLLFFVGGGLGWWLPVRDAASQPSFVAAIGVNLWDPAAQQEGNFRWLNVFFSLIAPQRSFLFGLPLGLLALRLLERAEDAPAASRFLIAGAVAGLLPFAHLGTLLALAVATPLLFLGRPDRRWVAFFAAWVLVAAPQLWLQQGVGPGALASLRWAPGWVSAPDAWVVFWIKNLGPLLPLAVAALLVPGLAPDRSRRVLTALILLFVAGNLVVFQPWDWDNTKVLVYAFLAVCVLSAFVLVRAWRAHAVWRVPVAIALGVAMASGALENAHQALGRDRHRLLDSDEIDLARRVREETEPRALFVCGLQHNHPVPVLAGRRVLLAYTAWHWSQGVDPEPRRREVEEILALRADAEELLVRYDVHYVVIGPWEREHGADPAAFRARFPCPIRTRNYEVFDVRGISARSETRAASRTPAR